MYFWSGVVISWKNSINEHFDWVLMCCRDVLIATRRCIISFEGGGRARQFPTKKLLHSKLCEGSKIDLVVSTIQVLFLMWKRLLHNPLPTKETSAIWRWEVIYQTRETVFDRDIQTPRRELKIRRAAEYFWRNSRCLESRWNNVSSVW